MLLAKPLFQLRQNTIKDKRLQQRFDSGQLLITESETHRDFDLNPNGAGSLAQGFGRNLNEVGGVCVSFYTIL